MIDIDAELESALNDRKKYGDIKGRQATADDYVKGVYAMLYSEAPEHLKTVPERDSWVKRHPTYEKAVLEKSNRYAEWEAARLKMQILFAAVEKYRTDAATERNMMRAVR
jgi:hypothetical protein